MSTTDTMAMRPLLFPDDTQFWYETPRALGHTAYGGADIGEVVTTAQRITANDYFTDAEGACAPLPGRRPAPAVRPDARLARRNPGRIRGPARIQPAITTRPT